MAGTMIWPCSISETTPIQIDGLNWKTAFCCGAMEGLVASNLLAL